MNHPVIENLTLQELPPATAKQPNQKGAALLPPDLDLIRHVQVALTATIGTADIAIERLFSLHEGDVVALRERVTEPVTLLIDNRPVARGLLVAVDDRLGVEITEILPR